MPDALAPGDTLLTRLLGAAGRGGPADGLGFIGPDETDTLVPWAAVAERAARAATALREAGVQPHERVAIVIPTDILFFDAFFGVLAAGAVPVPLYPPVRLGRLDEYFDRTAAMLRAAGCVALVADARVRRVIGRVLPLAPLRLGVLAAERLRAAAPGPFAAPDAEDIALVQFSSGTTVAPKAVALSHRAVLHNAAAILSFLPEGGPVRQVGVSWLPLYHDMGLIGCVFVALVRAGPLWLLPPERFLARPALWLRALSRHRGTVSPAPDFAYALCVERITDAELDGVDLGAWALALDGAEPISADTLRRFTARFAAWGLSPAAPTPVYGLSEASLAVTFSTVERPFRAVRWERAALSAGHARPADRDAPAVELVSNGRPIPGMAVEVRGPTGQALPAGAVGRVWVSGPSLLTRYLGADTHPVVDGWLDTGDVGFLDGGELFLCGRARDLIVLRGRNHAPQDLERAADAVPGVRTGCVIAVGHPTEDGERVCVFAEAREPRPTLADEIEQAVRAATGVDPHVVLVLEPGTLPRTSSGKLRRGEALRRWLDGALTPPAPVTPWLLAGALARSALGYLRQ